MKFFSIRIGRQKVIEIVAIYLFFACLSYYGKSVQYDREPVPKRTNRYIEVAKGARDKTYTYGYISANGSKTLPPKFESADNFDHNLAVVQEGTKWGVIDASGTYVLKPSKSVIMHALPIQFSSNGLAPIALDKKYGYVNRAGTFKIQPQFEAAGAFENNVAWVELKEKWGLIDSKGKWIIKPTFDDVTKNGDDDSIIGQDKGLFQVSTQNETTGSSRYGVVDARGKWVLPLTYHAPLNFCDGLVVVDRTTEESAKQDEDNAKREAAAKPADETSEVAAAEDDTAIGSDEATAAEDTAIGSEATAAENAANGSDDTNAAAADDTQTVDSIDTQSPEPELLNEYIVLNRSGKVVFKLKAQDLQNFNDGVAVFERNDKYGVIDRHGKIIVPAKFNTALADQFSNGSIQMSSGATNLFWVTNSGVVKPVGKGIEAILNPPIVEGLAAMRIDRKWGFVDKHGNIVIQPTFDDVSDFHNGMARVGREKPRH